MNGDELRKHGKTHMEKIQTATSQIAQAVWKTPQWYHAATLAERIAGLPEGKIAQFEGSTGKREQAERKLRQWKEQAPFNKSSFFSARLAMDSITEQELFALLAEPIEIVQARLAMPT